MKKHHEGFSEGCGLFTRKDNSLTSLKRSRSGRSLSPAFLSTLLVLPLSLAVWGGTAAAFTEGGLNNFFGDGAGNSNSGNYNSFFGGYAGNHNTTGDYNSFFGYYAGYENTTGYYNSFFGEEAGYYNTTGYYNSFFGRAAGFHNTTGGNNSFFGYSAGGSNTTGGANSFFGGYAGYHNQVESLNTFVGYNADLDGTTDSVTNATAIGARAYVSQANSLVLGSIKGVNYATESVNVGIGTPAPQRQLHLSGDKAVFRMDRSKNTAAFLMVRTDETTGNPMKTFVVGTNASAADDGEFIINDLGTAVAGDGYRRMTIDNNGDVEFTGSVTAPEFHSSSSLAYKTNVRTYENALETVRQLRGVRFDWKDSGKPAVGLIAEEVEGVVPEIVAYDEKSGAATGLNYANLVGVLVEAIKEQQVKHQAEMESLKAVQQAKLDGQQAKLDGQQAKLDGQQAEIESLKKEQQAKLDEQQVKHQAEIESLKAVQQAKLDGHQAEIDSLKKELNDLRTVQQAKLTMQQAELESLKAEMDRQLKALLLARQ